MGSQTGIAWTDHTFNPWRGCTKVSAGCANCYAEALSKRSPAVLGEWGPTGKRAIAAESYWRLPVQWNAAAKRDGVRRRVFCASLSDVFEDRPELVAPRARLFDTIARTPHLDWLLLTKRPENVLRLWPGTVVENPPMVEVCGHMVFSNVWLGVSVEDQATADARIPILLDTPAAGLFVSYEPALGKVSFDRLATGELGRLDSLRGYYFVDGRNEPISTPRLNWLIVGGESGPKARPFDVGWARSVVEQCRRAGVPCFVKQLGARPIPLTPMRLPSFDAVTGRRHRGWIEDGHHAISDPAGADPAEWPEDLRVREFPRLRQEEGR